MVAGRRNLGMDAARLGNTRGCRRGVLLLLKWSMTSLEPCVAAGQQWFFRYKVKELGDMKRRKLWIWVLGVVIAAGVVAFVRSRAGADDLAVQLVDQETGKSVTNAVVKISEPYTIPGLSALRFLPSTFYSRVLEREVRALI